MGIKVAINGFGRIGRLAFRLMAGDEDFDVVAVNDLTDARTLAHLLKYDSTHGVFSGEVTHGEQSITAGGKEVPVFAEKDPAKLPWGRLGVDIVLECTGRFTSREASLPHVQAGARRVLLSAPASGPGVKTVVYNVNHSVLDGSEDVVSAASCTTNCLAPAVKVLDDEFGLVYGYMTTVHAYTNDQVILDAAHKDLRRARSAAVNIIPTSTGAASAVGEVLPHLKGRLDGMAMRVPVASGSVVDLTCQLKKRVTAAQVNQAFTNAVSETLAVTGDPIVSGDVIGMAAASLVDLSLTSVMDFEGGQAVKVVSWYDNEASYTHQLVRLAKYYAGM